MTLAPTQDLNRPALGIMFVLLGMFAMSINDMLIKQLSGGYPLHQIVFTRSVFGIVFSLAMVQAEGGLRILHTRNPWLHTLRGLLIVISNMTYFTALAVLPLANTAALFFVAPLMITLLSIPLLGEKVGPFRIGAVVVGFIGVLIMLQPWQTDNDFGVSWIVMFLPIIAALTYALNQILTRKLGATTKASALVVYIQATFIIVSVIFWLAAGDGRYAVDLESESLIFLLRAWVWPTDSDLLLFGGLGLISSVIGYALSQAYRVTDAATVAPFEYIGLPLAVFWGWLFWAELPDFVATIGITLIMASGVFVFLREKIRARPVTKPVNRKY